MGTHICTLKRMDSFSTSSTSAVGTALSFSVTSLPTRRAMSARRAAHSDLRTSVKSCRADWCRAFSNSRWSRSSRLRASASSSIACLQLPLSGVVDTTSTVVGLATLRGERASGLSELRLIARCNSL